MQTQKLIKKIEKSFENFLIAKLKKQNFSFIFNLSQITIKGNIKEIDQEQLKLKNLANKYNGLVLLTNKTIKGTIIVGIKFSKEADYLFFLQKSDYYKKFCKNLDIISSSSINALLFGDGHFIDFLEKNIFKINEYDNYWGDILKCVEYFLQNKKSNLYLRELPIKVHSKFIEKNKKIISDILYFLYNELDLDLEGNTFEEQFFINTKPNFVRFRFLDELLNQNFFGSIINDISLKIDDFNKLDIINLENIYIVENEINYLTFPKKTKSIVIWGAGFNILNLRNIIWFKEKNIYYFGDIDSHGFKILANFRKYFKQTKSIFMNNDVFQKFKDYSVEGKTISESELENLKEYLNKDEYDIASYLNKNSKRLEQENITEEYIKCNISSMQY